MALNTVVALIGIVMIRQIPAEHIWARFVGYYFIIVFSADFPLTMVMITSIQLGSLRKRVQRQWYFVFCS